MYIVEWYEGHHALDIAILPARFFLQSVNLISWALHDERLHSDSRHNLSVFFQMDDV